MKMLQMRHPQHLLPAVRLRHGLQITRSLFLSLIEADCHLLFRLLITGPRRAALCILSQIKIQREQFVKILLRQSILLFHFPVQKSAQNLDPLHTGIRFSVKVFFLVIIRQRLIQLDRPVEQRFRRMHRIAVLKAVVIDLQHLLDLLEAKQLAARDPLRLQHFIRRRAVVNDAILLRAQIHLGALQYLEKAKLQLLRIQRIHRIKRMAEALKILIRKPRNQIQMLMDVVRSLHTVHVLRNLLKRRSPMDCRKRIPVDCLHTDLQLQKTRPQCPKQLQFLFIQKIRRDLTVKIRDPIVMIPQKTPQLQRPRMAAVEGAVYELDLLYAFVQKILKLLLYKIKAAVPHPFIDG